jgi:O-antigen ligase
LESRVAAPAVGLERVATVLVLVALVYAVLSHGAFYADELRVTTVLFVAAAVTSAVAVRPQRHELDAAFWAPLALGGWYVIAGVAAHDAGGAVAAVSLLVSLASAVFVVRRASADERRVVLAGVVAVGVLVAATGWAGVALRQYPHALEDGGLWRAASTITYSNATAGLLAMVALLALGGFVRDRRGPSTIAAYMIVVGLLATLSRAGIIGFIIGFVVLIVTTRGRILVRTWQIFAGAALATITLLPSMPASHGARPALAFAGLAAGVLVVLAPPRLVVVGALGCAALLVGSPQLRGDTSSALHPIVSGRVSTDSPDRVHERNAALHLAATHLLAGAGPGRVDLHWDVVQPEPETMHVAYAHDEYLQTLDESGVVGLAIVVVGCGAVTLALIRRARTQRAANAAVVIAALVAVAVHSSMDFLWHVPVIPLAAALLVGDVLSSSLSPSPKERTP